MSVVEERREHISVEGDHSTVSSNVYRLAVVRSLD